MGLFVFVLIRQQCPASAPQAAIQSFRWQLSRLLNEKAELSVACQIHSFQLPKTCHIFIIEHYNGLFPKLPRAIMPPPLERRLRSN